jgi:hypothetical protein
MSSLPKESMGTKWLNSFDIRVVERRNMINDYLRGRACIESVRGVDFRGVLILSVCLEFELFLLFLALLYHFA